jgi:hypothetical protein
MATPTIIIGIGSSGLYTLENVQRFYYETYKKNKPDHVEYLYLETNKDNLVGVTPVKNEIRRVYISLAEMAKMVKELKESGCGDWLPPANQILDAGIGAGNIRSCGRLALWGTNSADGDNFRNVIEAIKETYSRVDRIDTGKGTSNKPTVFITGTFTGGTGSGIFIDMAYLVRHLIYDVKELFGLFLIPGDPSSIKRDEVSYANTYAALKDLEYYNDVNNVYQEKWPNLIEKPFPMPPYELVQFISQDYSDGAPAIKGVEGLYKMAGLYLFLNIAGIKEKRMDLLVNAKPAGHIDKYGTFGLSAIQFPKDQIQEYISLELSNKLISRWTDAKQYYANSELIPISVPLIEENTNKIFDDFLNNAFNILNNVSGKNLLTNEIEKEVLKIVNKDIKGNPVDYIVKLFSSSGETNFYHFVKNNIQPAIDDLIDNIYNFILSNLNKSENLYHTRYTLLSIKNSIDKVLNYWRQLGLSSKSDIWETILFEQAKNTQKNTYKPILEQGNVLKDRLLTIFEMLKMHLLIKGLIDLSNGINNSKIPLKSSVSKNELPQINTIDTFITRLLEVTGNIEAYDRNIQIKYFTFKKRKDNILKDIKDDSIPIHRIYPSGDFDKECENSLSRFNQSNSGSNVSKKDVVDDNGVSKINDIYSYLNSLNNRNFHNEIYTDLLIGFRNKVERYGSVAIFNVSEYVKDNPKIALKYARRSLCPFIKTDKTLLPSTKLPKFIAGADSKSINEVVKSFENENFMDFSNSKDRILELPDMSNILIFYDEKGGIDLLKDLTYIEQMKEVYENPPKSDNISKEMWLNYRNAYKKL